MDLKAKVQEVKEYSSIKNELITLIQDYLEKEKEYTSTYDLAFKDLSEKLETDFIEIFQKEDFETTKEEKNYSNIYEQYTTIKAFITDLEFELTMQKNFDNIEFNQLKPDSERKRVIINPTIKRYRLNGFSLKQGYGNTSIRNIDDLKRQIEHINNAKYSVGEMNEFKNFIKKEIDLLLNEFQRLKNEKYRGIAYFSEYAGSSNNKNFGEFDNLNELIERI